MRLCAEQAMMPHVFSQHVSKSPMYFGNNLKDLKQKQTNINGTRMRGDQGPPHQMSTSNLYAYQALIRLLSTVVSKIKTKTQTITL